MTRNRIHSEEDTHVRKFRFQYMKQHTGENLKIIFFNNSFFFVVVVGGLKKKPSWIMTIQHWNAIWFRCNNIVFWLNYNFVIKIRKKQYMINMLCVLHNRSNQIHRIIIVAEIDQFSYLSMIFRRNLFLFSFPHQNSMWFYEFKLFWTKLSPFFLCSISHKSNCP